MKTLVLQLDRTEDAGSIRDKVTWGKASRVLLVWPVNFSVLDRKIDLVTVRRICASQGSRLGIVCDIPEIIAEAEGLQIPVFDTVNSAMRRSWDRRKGRKARRLAVIRETGNTDIEQLRIDKYILSEFWKINENVKFPVFLLAIIAVVAILIFLFPTAKITIFPLGRPSEMQIEFRVNEAAGSASTPGILAARKKTLAITGEISIPTTGSLLVPDKKAIGTVTITNLTSSKVTIPAETIIQKQSKPPTRYQILEEVNISSEEAVAGIGIKAVEPGEAGNTDTNTVTSLDGPLGLLVEVTNPASITGGSSKSYQAVSEEDKNQAAKQIQEILKNQAESEFSKILADQDIILPSSIHIVQVVEQSEQPGVGQAGMLLKLNQTAEYSVLVINLQDLEKQAETILNANQPDKGWVNSSVKTVDVRILSQEMDAETGSVILNTSATKMLTPPLDINTIRSQIAGKSKTRANEIIVGSVLNVTPPEILTTPDWLPFLPLLSFRIQIEVR